MGYKIIELTAGQWTGLIDAEDNEVPLKCQNLTSDAVMVIETDGLEKAREMNIGFVIPPHHFFETTSLHPVFFKAHRSGKLIYMVDVRA